MHSGLLSLLTLLRCRKIGLLRHSGVRQSNADGQFTLTGEGTTWGRTPQTKLDIQAIVPEPGPRPPLQALGESGTDQANFQAKCPSNMPAIFLPLLVQRSHCHGCVSESAAVARTPATPAGRATLTHVLRSPASPPPPPPANRLFVHTVIIKKKKSFSAFVSRSQVGPKCGKKVAVIVLIHAILLNEGEALRAREDDAD